MDERLVAILATVAIVVIASAIADRVFRVYERRLAETYRGDFAAAKTRFRLIRRVFVAIVILIGVLSLLTTVEATAEFAASLLASSAVAAVIAGFAIRTPLANVAAGLQIAMTQPFRLGDRITAPGATGVVDEINLSYTVLRTDDGRRAYLPNEQLIASTIVNATIDDPKRAETVTVPVSPDADLAAARGLLVRVASDVPGRVPEPAPTVRFSEASRFEVIASLTAWVADGDSAVAVGSDLRERAVTALREAGMAPPRADGG